MKNRKFVLAAALTAILLLGIWWLRKPFSETASQPIAPARTNPIAPVAGNLTATGTHKLIVSNTTSTNLSEMYQAYRSGQIDKGKMMAAIWQAENKKPQDLFGKIIDQYGQPVVGANVTGDLMLIQGADVGEKEEIHKTQTDANGEFEFTGLQGWKLAVALSKEGYEIGRNPGVYEAPNDENKTSPTGRSLYKMWKLKGAEPMIHTEFDSRVPYDGTSATFDLATGQKIPNGNLRITLLRNPLQIQRGRDKYDWSVKIEIIGGGILEENDLYPNWAPENGYQPAFEAGMNATDVPWNRELVKNFYIKDNQGRYGRLYVDLFTDSMRPDTGINIRTWINPSGSQNLEFDPSKQIR